MSGYPQRVGKFGHGNLQSGRQKIQLKMNPYAMPLSCWRGRLQFLKYIRRRVVTFHAFAIRQYQ